MNYKVLGRFVARILSLEALFMLPALCISLFGRETAAVKGFLITIGMIAAISGILLVFCRKAPNAFRAKEGLVCVGISWLVLSIV